MCNRATIALLGVIFCRRDNPPPKGSSATIFVSKKLAPVTDLSDWRYEGVIWRKKDDPLPAPWLLKQLYAPDVVQGSDGRYYLYYFKGNSGIIGVAVCDTPWKIVAFSLRVRNSTTKF